MEDSKDTQNAVPAQVPDMNAFAAVLAQAITTGIAATQRHQIGVGQYDPMRYGQNKGDWRKLKFRANVTYLQNGVPINIATAMTEEVNWLNHIHRPGKYLDGFFEVSVREEGPDSTTIDIRNNASTKDAMNEAGRKHSGFLDLLKKIVAEQDVAEKEEEEWHLDRATRPKSKEFFNSKASKEAREAREAREKGNATS